MRDLFLPAEMEKKLPGCGRHGREGDCASVYLGFGGNGRWQVIVLLSLHSDAAGIHRGD